MNRRVLIPQTSAVFAAAFMLSGPVFAEATCGEPDMDDPIIVSVVGETNDGGGCVPPGPADAFGATPDTTHGGGPADDLHAPGQAPSAARRGGARDASGDGLRKE